MCVAPAIHVYLNSADLRHVARVCNRLSGYSGYSDIRKNLSVRIAIYSIIRKNRLVNFIYSE